MSHVDRFNGDVDRFNRDVDRLTGLVDRFMSLVGRFIWRVSGEIPFAFDQTRSVGARKDTVRSKYWDVRHIQAGDVQNLGAVGHGADSTLAIGRRARAFRNAVCGFGNADKPFATLTAAFRRLVCITWETARILRAGIVAHRRGDRALSHQS